MLTMFQGQILSQILCKKVTAKKMLVGECVNAKTGYSLLIGGKTL